MGFSQHSAVSPERAEATACGLIAESYSKWLVPGQAAAESRPGGHGVSFTPRPYALRWPEHRAYLPLSSGPLRVGRRSFEIHMHAYPRWAPRGQPNRPSPTGGNPSKYGMYIYRWWAPRGRSRCPFPTAGEYHARRSSPPESAGSGDRPLRNPPPPVVREGEARIQVGRRSLPPEAVGTVWPGERLVAATGQIHR